MELTFLREGFEAISRLAALPMGRDQVLRADVGSAAFEVELFLVVLFSFFSVFAYSVLVIVSQLSSSMPCILLTDVHLPLPFHVFVPLPAGRSNVPCP